MNDRTVRTHACKATGSIPDSLSQVLRLDMRELGCLRKGRMRCVNDMRLFPKGECTFLKMRTHLVGNCSELL